ncbi:MAG: 5-formyltetrahydrofolate cyclo-ligase [Gammaproteobacteria bacterium]|nr:5-formyltetrahydrofolate cyclo-ligase [Gammaproteobacteria bacterium]
MRIPVSRPSVEPVPLAAEGRSRGALRRLLRARRRDLDPAARRRAERALAARLLASPLLRGARRLGLYLAADGEMDPSGAIPELRRRRTRLHLPLIDPLRFGSKRLRFARVEPDSRFRRNRFGIPEPIASPVRPAWTLDLVLMPLVGFDRFGGRLGMGGGFYDRTFDPARPQPRRPLLVGLAHACQEVDRLPMAAHDVPLDAVITDRETHLFDPD